MFLPRIVNRVINGEAITISPTGGIRVNPILVDDVADLLDSLLGRKTPPLVNIGGPDVVSIQQIAEHVGRLVAKEPIWEIGAQSSDIIADITTMKESLDEVQLTPLNKGLEYLVQNMRHE